MGVIHTLSAFAEGGLKGVQASQRDWSPFLAHCTSYAAMAQVRDAIKSGLTPTALKDVLAIADDASFEIVKQIAASKSLLRRCPAGDSRIPECVCFSECTLPGLIGLAERFGRFGFVFKKSLIFGVGGRPCSYLAREEYAVVSQLYDKAEVGSPEWRLFGLSNVLSPPGSGQVQDFSHEREWRSFAELDFNKVKPTLFLAPEAYIDRMRQVFGSTETYIPIDLLFQWGA